MWVQMTLYVVNLDIVNQWKTGSPSHKVSGNSIILLSGRETHRLWESIFRMSQPPSPDPFFPVVFTLTQGWSMVCWMCILLCDVECGHLVLHFLYEVLLISFISWYRCTRILSLLKKKFFLECFGFLISFSLFKLVKFEILRHVFHIFFEGNRFQIFSTNLGVIYLILKHIFCVLFFLFSSFFI